VKDPIIRVQQIQRDFDKRKPISRNDIQFLIDFGLDKDRQYYKVITRENERMETILNIAIRREALQRKHCNLWDEIRERSMA